jgi:large repetitive protein
MNILGSRTPRESARGRMRLSTVRAISMFAVVGVVGVLGVLGGGQAVANNGVVSFCHATDSVTHPYVFKPDMPAADVIKEGHGGHDGLVFNGAKKPQWGDIIPVFDYPAFGKTKAGTFPGKNVDAVEAWVARKCAPPTDLPETHLTLVKVVDNTGGGEAKASDWALKADGPKTVLSGQAGDDALSNALVEPGTYTLSESGHRSGYDASPWSCTGNEVARAQTANTVTLAAGDSVTCTITNTFKHHDNDKQAHLTLVKVVDNTGGGEAKASDWALKADGPKTVLSGQAGDDALSNALVEPGTYTLSESGHRSGYDASPWSCTGNEVARAQTANTVTLAAGDSVTCTITNTFKHHDNDKQAHLTLVKVVDNTGGGEAKASDWALKADGPKTVLSGQAGDDALSNALVEPGTYTLSESGDRSGYDASPWSCTASEVTNDRAVARADTANTVTLAAGDSVTCTITNTFKHHDNDKQAHLTLVKVVVNNGVGTAHVDDWTLNALKADGEKALKADGKMSLSGKSGVTGRVVQGSYTLSESGGPTGYTASAWSCSDKTVIADVVTLKNGDDVTCTITNTFPGRHVDNSTHLTLVKNVVNDGGGTALATAWTLNAVGPVTISGTSGSSSVNGALVQPGDFTLSETGGPSGYTASAWSCPSKTVTALGAVTLVAGDSVTCTITNTFRPAHLTLIKKVVNGHGGNAPATRWTLKAAGPVTISGASGSATVTDAAVPAGDFKLSESGGPSGYTASAWSCLNKTVTAGAVSLVAGESATCTITNTQNAPKPVEVLGVSETAQPASGTTTKAAAVGPKSLAFTGPAEILPLGLVGLFSLALGGVLTAVSRRRVRI